MSAYDIIEVDENASEEEIIKAYNRKVEEIDKIEDVSDELIKLKKQELFNAKECCLSKLNDSYKSKVEYRLKRYSKSITSTSNTSTYVCCCDSCMNFCGNVGECICNGIILFAVCSFITAVVKVLKGGDNSEKNIAENNNTNKEYYEFRRNPALVKQMRKAQILIYEKMMIFNELLEIAKGFENRSQVTQKLAKLDADNSNEELQRMYLDICKQTQNRITEKLKYFIREGKLNIVVMDNISADEMAKWIKCKYEYLSATSELVRYMNSVELKILIKNVNEL